MSKSDMSNESVSRTAVTVWSCLRLGSLGMMKRYRCNSLVLLSTDILEISRNDRSTAFLIDRKG